MKNIKQCFVLFDNKTEINELNQYINYKFLYKFLSKIHEISKIYWHTKTDCCCPL